MKKAVAYLEPFMEAEKEEYGSKKRGTMVIATVKGDVHDIGKNIVGVVLACNNWEVIDLGVMVSCAKILEAVRNHNADILGLSGLITPSLDEMIHNAQEMQKGGYEYSLIDWRCDHKSCPHRHQDCPPFMTSAVVQVPDASLVVNVCNDLTQEDKKEVFISKLKKDQEKAKEEYEARWKKRNSYHSLIPAKKDQVSIGKTKRSRQPFPEKLGVHRISLPNSMKSWNTLTGLHFFWSWELKGKYPDIFDRSDVGERSQKTFLKMLRNLLERIIKEKAFTCEAVVGLWPAQLRSRMMWRFLKILRNPKRLGTIPLSTETTNSVAKTSSFMSFRFHCTPEIPANLITLVLLQFVQDQALKKWPKNSKNENDDYSCDHGTKALGDRFAEAMAELAHKKVREWWSYGMKENLSNQALIKEEYQGIRPACGYP